VNRIVLLGKDGRLGRDLQRALAPLAELIALGRRGADPGATDASQVDVAAMYGDLKRLDELGATIRTLRPDVIVNAAAFTDVDGAEDEVEAAEAVNAMAPGELAHLCAELGAWLIHFSTDHVFDGSGTRPWREEDAPAPLNAYGRSKLAGEERIRASGCKHLILRCSWLYALRGRDFPDAILRQAREQDELRVVDDQVGAPTGADLVADVTAHALRGVAQRPELGGTYHVAAAGETSRFDYACFVIDHALALGARLKAGREQVRAVSSAAYASVARRPLNSLLACDKLERTFALRMPPWQAGVRRMLREKVLT
jgi:dTDP-4-dehydrorhamnose reductase